MDGQIESEIRSAIGSKKINCVLPITLTPEFLAPTVIFSLSSPL